VGPPLRPTHSLQAAQPFKEKYRDRLYDGEIAYTDQQLGRLLDAVGKKAPPNVQGTSLVPAFSGKAVPTEISYEETLYPKLALGIGASGSEKVETNMVDERQMAQLRSLGYLSGFSPQHYDLNGQGVDPKSRIGILKLLFEAESSASNLPEARRITLLEQALREDPTNPSLYHQLGGELEKTGRYDQALHLYQTALQHGVENGRLHSRIADLELRRGNKNQAVAEYEKAARFNPSDLDSQTNLATAYLEKGRVDDAERVFNFVITSDPDHAAANNGLGLVSIQKHDFNAARGHFEKAVQLDPDLVEAQMNLGLLYEMAGDRARARTYFETFLAKASPAQYCDVIPKVKQELATLH
jgi:Flp pilus assembly protein TadD